MRINNLVVMVAGWIAITGCDLGGVADNCNNRQFFTAAEFYLIEEGGTQFLSGQDTLINPFTLCETVNAPDTAGFANLYSIDGIIIQDCLDGICVQVNRFSNPYCELEYDVGGSNLSLFGVWKIASLQEDTTHIFPSCNEIQLSLNITPNADSSRYLTEGIFGANSFFITFRPVDGNGLLPDLTRRTLLNNSPYAWIVEDKLDNFFASDDTIRYSIQSNEMTFDLPDRRMNFFQEI